jgi:hypothetical protein
LWWLGRPRWMRRENEASIPYCCGRRSLCPGRSVPVKAYDGDGRLGFPERRDCCLIRSKSSPTRQHGVSRAACSFWLRGRRLAGFADHARPCAMVRSWKNIFSGGDAKAQGLDSNGLPLLSRRGAGKGWAVVSGAASRASGRPDPGKHGRRWKQARQTLGVSCCLRQTLISI